MTKSTNVRLKKKYHFCVGMIIRLTSTPTLGYSEYIAMIQHISKRYLVDTKYLLGILHNLELERTLMQGNTKSVPIYSISY